MIKIIIVIITVIIYYFINEFFSVYIYKLLLLSCY